MFAEWTHLTNGGTFSRQSIMENHNISDIKSKCSIKPPKPAPNGLPLIPFHSQNNIPPKAQYQFRICGSSIPQSS